METTSRSRTTGAETALARSAGRAVAVPADRIERRILLLRGEKVMLDTDLARLYGVPTKVLNQAVKRNLQRFPADFMFRLSVEEARILDGSIPNAGLRSQIVTSKRGGRRVPPYVFTEHGVAMLSSVLHSPRAVQVNIEIMRAFARLRSIFASHAQLARQLGALERKYDGRFRIVFSAIRRLMASPRPRRRPIGFRPA
ncbi:MAG: ORF6N domain-containing protein [Deltaproteobacteria bacterium]|nr:ORF6N domain-containing protein [Deltaproteobacteria bacterium]